MTRRQAILASIVRTAVPVVVAFLVSLAARAGLQLDTQAQETIADATAAAIGLGYYAGVRWLETKVPALSVLLGSSRQPAGYVPDASVVEVVEVGEHSTEAVDSGQITGRVSGGAVPAGGPAPGEVGPESVEWRP